MIQGSEVSWFLVDVAMLSDYCF